MASIVQVALDTPVRRLFDYECPAGMRLPEPGSLVEVPFGTKRCVAVVMRCSDASSIPSAKLRKAIRLLDDRPGLSPELLHFAQFCADYYHYPLGPILLGVLPPRLRAVTAFCAATPWLHATSAGRSAEPPRNAPVQRQLLALLRADGSLHREVIRTNGLSRVAALLVKCGWVEWQAEPAVAEQTAPPNLHLRDATPEQRAVLQALRNAGDGFRVHLLHGVTGSGKTEVYLRLIQAAQARQRQTLVLVPEIALTPQLEQHFRARFPESRIALLHSGLNDRARAENWLAAAHCDLLLGTRLAVFAPLPKLGLIVVDEEHDNSFKQQDGLRYSARDMAVVRAKQRDIPIVLGSATPSLESYARALQGRYDLHTLAHRAIADARLPPVTLVDLRHVPVENGLTLPVREALTENLARREQSLVFLNRRGYAPALYCPACTWVAPCPRCSSRLVLHRSGRRLRCHHCGYETRIPEACPDCGNPDMKALGQGTQRLEETLRAVLPDARIRRIDRDSMRPRAWAELGDSLHRGEIDVLVGTQMLAKGHDFPNMTLAVVLDTDGALYSPDFRATERLFAQLMQVAGRAGRASKAGRVLVQTAFPDHPLFQHLLRHDYPAFAKMLLAERHKLDLPPVTRQALLRAEAPRMDAAITWLRSAAGLAPTHAGVTVFDPVAAPMARIAGLERAQLLVQSASRHALQQFLAVWRAQIESIRPRVARWSLDVDPLEF